MHLCSEDIFLLNVAVLFMIGYPCSATFSLIMLSSRKLLHLPRKIIPCLYVQLLLLVYAIETINFFPFIAKGLYPVCMFEVQLHHS